MKYAIGDVARTLGLTTAGLHFFEREGVIEPRKGEGTRRYYDAEDIIRLISYKKYRSMQMPLKAIAHQFSPEGESSDGIRQKLNAQHEELLALARRYEQLAEDIRWFEQAILRAENGLDAMEIGIMPECCLLAVGEDGIISRSRAEQENVASWLDAQPATRLSVVSRSEGEARFGYSISRERARTLGLDHTPGAVLLPSAVALHTFRKMPRAYFNAPQLAFETLWQEMHARGFHQAGMALGVNLCVECTDGRRDVLCELWLPIK